MGCEGPECVAGGGGDCEVEAVLGRAELDDGVVVEVEGVRTEALVGGFVEG